MRRKKAGAEKTDVGNSDDHEQGEGELSQEASGTTSLDDHSNPAEVGRENLSDADWLKTSINQSNPR